MDFMHESIFVAAIRKFCTSFAAAVGILIAMVLILIGFTFMSTPDLFPDQSTFVIAPDAHGRRELLPGTDPALLRIDIKGVIGEGGLVAHKIQNMLFDSREGILHNNRVKGVLLYIDTPGGAAADSDNIYRALMEYKSKYNVPIYAFVEGMCASGGMYVASAADKIYASSSSIIGSVGVILGPNFNFSGLMEKYGVESLTITQGLDKDELNPFRPWKPDEGASLQAITVALYERFVGIVTKARPLLDKDKLIKEYGAQVYIAQEAQKLGYIDEASSDYYKAVNELAKAANIPDAMPYQMMKIEAPRHFLSNFAETKLSLLNGKVTHVFQLGPYLNSEMSGKFLYLYQPGVEGAY